MCTTFTAAPRDGATKMVPTKAMMKGRPRVLMEEFAGATNTKGNKAKRNSQHTVQSHTTTAPSCTVTCEADLQAVFPSGDEGTVQNLTMN